MMWSGILGISGLVIWGAGIPLTAFIILFKYRKELDKEGIKKYYLMIYQGLKNK
jgi:hypothetical protein